MDGNMYAFWYYLARADGTPDGVEGDIDGGHGVGGGLSGKGTGDRLPAYNSTSPSGPPASQRFSLLFILFFGRLWVSDAGDQISRAPIRYSRLIGRIRHRSDSHSLPTQ